MARTIEENPEVQWFEPIKRTCCMCGKPSNGILHGRRNESFGEHCQKCADKRIAAAKRVRESLAKERAGS